jgi:tRNA-dihydrouridine synthase C
MLGRAALANPQLPHLMRQELGLTTKAAPETDWPALFLALAKWSDHYHGEITNRTLFRLKQWMKIATLYGKFENFDTLKQVQSVEELIEKLPNESATSPSTTC